VEAVLRQHPDVATAAVVAREVGDDRELVAVVVPRAGILATALQVFWQADAAYRDEPGVISDPVARLEFKLQQHNLRPRSPHALALQPPELDDAMIQKYLARQSYRTFAPRPISFAAFSQLLQTLAQAHLPDLPLAKYRYPSALGLYPVQAYLYVKPGLVEGVDGGYYYYQPAGHELEPLDSGVALSAAIFTASEQPIWAQAGFALFLVAHLDAVEPLYGRQLAEQFCLLEAGYIGQLLMTEAPAWQIGLCPVATFAEDATLHAQLGLSERQSVLHAFLGGAIDPVQTRQWLQPTTGVLTPHELEQRLLAHLGECLPPQMVPAWVHLIEALPLTPNGKLDRQQVARLPLERPAPQAVVVPRFDRATYAASSTQERQAVVLQILTGTLMMVGGFTVHEPNPTQELLRFRLDSLKAIEWRNQINHVFAIHTPMSRLLEGQTLHALAQFVVAVLDSQLLAQSRGACQTPTQHPGDPGTTQPSPGSDVQSNAPPPSSQGPINQPYKKQRGTL